MKSPIFKILFLWYNVFKSTLRFWEQWNTARFTAPVVCVIITLEYTKSKISQSTVSWAGLCTVFGFAEMPPVIFGGKGEAKRRPLTSGVVNNLGTWPKSKKLKSTASWAGLYPVSALPKCRRAYLAGRAKQNVFRWQAASLITSKARCTFKSIETLLRQWFML